MKDGRDTVLTPPQRAGSGASRAGLVLLGGALGFAAAAAMLVPRRAGPGRERANAPSPALDALAGQLRSFEARAVAPADLAALDTRVAALEARPMPARPVDLKPLEARVAALEGRPAPAAPAPAVSPARVQALAERVDRVATAGETAASEDRRRIAALAARLDRLEARLSAGDAPGAGRPVRPQPAGAVSGLVAPSDG